LDPDPYPNILNVFQYGFGYESLKKTRILMGTDTDRDTDTDSDSDSDTDSDSDGQHWFKGWTWIQYSFFTVPRSRIL